MGSILTNSVISFSGVAADDHIHDNVFLSVSRIEALVDSRVDIDIPDSTTIHKDVAMEVLGWEGNRDRTRCESSLRKFLKCNARLIKRLIFTGVGIDGGDGEHLLERTIGLGDSGKISDSRASIEHSWLVEQSSGFANDSDIRPELPNIMGGQVSPAIRQEVDHVSFITCFKDGSGSGVNSTS